MRSILAVAVAVLVTVAVAFGAAPEYTGASLVPSAVPAQCPSVDPENPPSGNKMYVEPLDNGGSCFDEDYVFLGFVGNTQIECGTYSTAIEADQEGRQWEEGGWSGYDCYYAVD